MDFSLDDYIVEKGLNVNNTGVRSRLGFQRGPNRSAGVVAPLSAKRFGQFGVNSSAIPYDARQKLTTRSSLSTTGQVLGSGRVVGYRGAVVKNESSTHMQPAALQNTPNHNIMLKTKFADARQRLEIKRRQQVDHSDARMKLLAKRRFGAQGEYAGVVQQQQQQQPFTRVATVPGDQRSNILSTRPIAGHPRSAPVILTSQSRSVPAAQSAQSRVLLTRSSLATRNVASAAANTRTSFGGKFAQPAPTTLSLSGSNLRRTFSTQSHQHSTASFVDVEFGGADIGAASRPYKISIVNDKYEEPKPIETIVTSRTARPLVPPGQIRTAASAASAAAKTAVTAAAVAAKRGLKPDGMTVTKMVAQQKQSILRDTKPAVPSSSPAATSDSARSPIQGYKISVSNLHPDVSLDDLLELYSDVGALKNARLIRPGVADIVFVNMEDAVAALQMYNTRELDGRPMVVKLLFQPPPLTSLKRCEPIIDLDIPLLHRALFKTVVEGSRPSAPVSFTVQL